MKKLFGAILVGSMIFGAVFVSASVLPLVPGTGSIQASDLATVTCQNNPVTVKYGTEVNGEGANQIASVTISGIESTCHGDQAAVNLFKNNPPYSGLNYGTPPLFTGVDIWIQWGTINGPSITLPFGVNTPGLASCQGDQAAVNLIKNDPPYSGLNYGTPPLFTGVDIWIQWGTINGSSITLPFGTIGAGGTSNSPKPLAAGVRRHPVRRPRRRVERRRRRQRRAARRPGRRHPRHWQRERPRQRRRERQQQRQGPPRWRARERRLPRHLERRVRALRERLEERPGAVRRYRTAGTRPRPAGDARPDERADERPGAAGARADQGAGPRLRCDPGARSDHDRTAGPSGTARRDPFPGAHADARTGTDAHPGPNTGTDADTHARADANANAHGSAHTDTRARPRAPTP